jgi:hypothetical protein
MAMRPFILPSRIPPINNRKELDEQLSELGRLIWRAIMDDDKINDILFELADAKLSLDNVDVGEARLEANAAEAIMEFEPDPEDPECQRPPVRSSEWSKYALYNFALDWVVDQALMRMKIEQRWPFQENDGLARP